MGPSGYWRGNTKHFPIRTRLDHFSLSMLKLVFTIQLSSISGHSTDWLEGTINAQLQCSINGLAKAAFSSPIASTSEAGSQKKEAHLMFSRDWFSPGFQSAACTPSVVPPTHPAPSSNSFPQNSSWTINFFNPPSTTQL